MDNEMSGALFRNKKNGVESRPDFRGYIVIGGVEYQVSAWSKTPKSGGDKFLSLKAQLPQEEKKEEPKKAEVKEEDDDFPI